MATKSLHCAASESITHKVHKVRRDGIITISWTPIAKVSVESDGEAQVLWHGDAVAKFNVNKEDTLGSDGS